MVTNLSPMVPHAAVAGRTGPDNLAEGPETVTLFTADCGPATNCRWYATRIGARGFRGSPNPKELWQITVPVSAVVPMTFVRQCPHLVAVAPDVLANAAVAPEDPRRAQRRAVGNREPRSLSALIRAAGVAATAGEIDRIAREIQPRYGAIEAATIVGLCWRHMTGRVLLDTLLALLVSREWGIPERRRWVDYAAASDRISSALMDRHEQRLFGDLPRDKRLTLYRATDLKKWTGYFREREEALTEWTYTNAPHTLETYSANAFELFAVKSGRLHTEIVLEPGRCRHLKREVLT